jgi:cell division septation protein DedD
MIKPLIILFNSISVFLFSFFFGDSPVSVTGNFPKNAAIGTEFTAELIVKKPNVSGFAKLQIEVPQGFTVKEVDSKSGNFSFSGTIAKIIWTSVPADEQFTVKFALVAAASAAGLKTIGSKFSYVSNNNKEVVDMAPVEIQVGDAASAPVAAIEPAPATSVTAIDPQPVTTTQPVTTPPTDAPPAFSTSPEPLSNVICSRLITKGASAGEYNVEVKVKKPGIKGFAKFQELLPAGYTAKSGKTNGSSFSVSDGKAKFVWVSLPAEDELEISYTLVKESTDNQDAKLEGEFSYLENDQTKKIKLPVDMISATGDIVANTGASAAVTTQPVTTTTTPATTTEPVTATSTEPVTATATQTSAVVAETKTTPTETTSPNTVVAKKEGNVAYVVQIGAFRNAIQSAVLSKKFNISETVKSEMADGYSKFMVGNYGEYKEARNHREEIRQKGCNSAFVAAYNGPKRITVQEALMITSQKWYK